MNAKKKRKKSYWQLYLLLLPAVIYVAIFSYGPMYGIIIAFKDYRVSLGYLGSEWVGFETFIKIFKDKDFLRALRNSISFNILPLIVVCP